ncbi:MAG: hypothetical protein WDA42_04825 [Candidatus Bathyarchaeia archaeon]
MPTVIITPIPDAIPDTSCATPGVITPSLSYAFDQPLYGKARAFAIKQQYNPTIQMQIITSAGQAVALTETPLLRFSEASLAIDRRVNGTVTVLDEDQGTISFNLPTGVRNTAGIWLAEIGVVENDTLVFNNELYVYVERSSFGSRPNGPPNIADIRLSLRDSDPFESELLSTNTYNLVEICHAATRAIQIYNEMPPSLNTFRKTTCNFPHRSLWTQGTQALLFDALIEQYRKNRLPYQAGGVSIDDQNKLQEYHAAAQQNIQEFKQRSMELKAQANVERGYGYL